MSRNRGVVVWLGRAHSGKQSSQEPESSLDVVRTFISLLSRLEALEALSAKNNLMSGFIRSP